MQMSNCREFRKAIDAASRPSELAPSVEQHLSDCGGCHQYAESNFQLLSLLVAQPRVEVPSDFDFRLRARIARARDEQRGWRWAVAQFWTNSFSWTQAGAAAVVLMAVTVSAGYYLSRDSGNAAQTEIAKVEATSTPQVGPATTGTLPVSTINQDSKPAPENRDSVAIRPMSPVRSNGVVAPAAPPAEVVQLASAEIPGSQEILVYQPSQSGRPARARSIVIPRRGQVAFGAQLASVRDASARPTQGAIETF
jgi:hypothetical protein